MQTLSAVSKIICLQVKSILFSNYTCIRVLNIHIRYSYIPPVLSPQAPSASLCLSLLDMHSSPVRSANVLLDLCDQVSKYLQPIAPGVKNPEVDYGLIVR